MKLMATIVSTRETTWKIRISPKNSKSETASIYRFWTIPENDELILIYDPSISLIVKDHATNKQIMIPMNLISRVRDALYLMYQKLDTKGLYNIVDGKLYLDKKTAEKCQLKTQLFHGPLLFSPTVYQDETESKAIHLSFQDVKAVVKQEDIPTIYNVLERLDIHTYSLMLTLLERMDEMDQKMDVVLDLLTNLLEKQELTQEMVAQILKLPEKKLIFPNHGSGIRWEGEL